jgi:ribonuclease-3
MAAVRFPEQLEQVSGYTFQDKSLLLRALTRLAYSKEQGLCDNAHLDALATLAMRHELIILTRWSKAET